METKFTKGPWEVYRHTAIYKDGQCIANMGNGHLEQMRANAALIAAAPDLYAACELVIKAYGHLDELTNPHVQACRAALSKARGE